MRAVLGVAALAFAGLVAVGLMALGDVPWPTTDPAVQAARREAAVAQAREDEARSWAAEAAVRASQPARELRAIAFNTTAAVVPVALLAVAAVWGWNRRDLIYPRESDGVLPARRVFLRTEDARASWAARREVDVTRASRPFPDGLDSLSVSYRSQNELGDPVAAALPESVAPTLAAAVLDVTTVFLGQAAGGPVTRPWDRWVSCAVGGSTGSGKTYTAVGLTLQALAAGHRVVLADPHSADPASLTARLAPAAAYLHRPPGLRQAVATTDHEVMEATSYVEGVLRDRAEGRDPDRTPVLLVLDEFTKSMRGGDAKKLASLLESVAQEGRKLGVRALLLGQRWSTSRAGGSGDLRNTMGDFVIHRMRPEDAKMLTGWPADELPGDLHTLPPGEAYVLSGEVATHVRQPRMDGDQVAAVARLLPALTQGHDLGPTSVQPGANPGPDAPLEALVAPGWPQVGPGLDGGAGPGSEALRLYREGSSVAEVTDALAGTRDRNSGTWKRMHREVQDELRRALLG